MSSRSPVRALAIALLTACAACAAVYPEVQTPLRPMPTGRVATKPPAELRSISVKRARVPETTRDGRSWDSGGGAAPDPYVVIAIDGRPVLRTPARENTFRPEWPDSPRGNFRVPSGARLRVELWDTNPVKDRPIGIREMPIGGVGPADEGELEIECDSGASIVLGWGVPEAKMGLGFSYELQTYDAVVTRVFEESPAAHAGVRTGDRILAIDREKVREMKLGELQTRLNVPRAEGVTLRLQHRDRSMIELVLKEGPVYPLWDELQAAAATK